MENNVKLLAKTIDSTISLSSILCFADRKKTILKVREARREFLENSNGNDWVSWKGTTVNYFT